MHNAYYTQARIHHVCTYIVLDIAYRVYYSRAALTICVCATCSYYSRAATFQRMATIRVNTLRRCV